MADSKHTFGIEITTDLKQAVESFQRLQRTLLEQARALAEAKQATAGAATAYKDAQAKADGLRVQVALGKTELERQATATGQSSVEYKALQHAVAGLTAQLKQADAAALTAQKAFERQRGLARELAAQQAQLSAQRERDRRSLQAEGVDVQRLGQAYQRLEQEQAAARRVADARATLGVRAQADITAEIARARQAYADLKASGLATLGELAQAKARMSVRIRELEGETRGWGATLEQVKYRLLGLGAALAGGIRFSFQGGGELAEFEKQIAAIATLGDKTPAQLRPLGQEIRALAQELGVSARDAAAANYQIVSSDVALEQSTQVLRQSIKAGITGMTDTKTAAEVGLGAMHAYGYGVGQLGRIYDVLFATVNKGVVTFPELAQQLGDVMAPARAAGVGLETVGAAIATLTLNGIKAPQAVTALKSAILQLAAPTQESQKALAEYGIRWNGLVGTLEQIKAKGLSLDQVMRVVGDRDAANGVLVLTQDLERLKRLLGEIGQSAGAFETAFGKMANTDAAKIQRFNSAWEEFKMTAGEAVLAATPLLEALTGLLRAFNALPGPVQALTGAITVLGGGWLVFGRALRAVAEVATLVWGAFRAGAAPVAAAQGAITGATGAAAGFSARLLAIPGPLGMVAAALASAGAAWLLFGRQADQGGRQAETAIERLRQAQAGLAAAAAQTPAALAQAAEAEITALESRRAAVAAQLQAARARAQQPRAADVPSTGDPVAEVIGLVSELANLERQIAAGRAVLARQRAADAPLPAPTATPPGAAGSGRSGRGHDTPYDATFTAAEAQYRLPPGFLKAVADVESSFNPRAISPAGAKGLMQFMPGTAQRFGLRDPFNAEASIQAAGKYFRTLLDLFKGDLVKAIAAYNAGEGNVQRLGIDKVLSPGFARGETRAYVPKVLGKLEQYGNSVGMQDQFERERDAAQERERLAEATTRFETTQQEASVEAAARADALTTARLEAAYQNRELSARAYYTQLDQIQRAATERELTELNRQVTVARAAQTTRTQGTQDYLQGQEAIFALEQKIAQTRDHAAQTAQSNQLALAAAMREQNQALTEQLHQVRVRLLELQAEGGPKLADIVIPPEQRELFQARLQVLEDQYRDFIERLRQAGDSAGLLQVRELITAEAMRDVKAKTDQVTEFGIQAARNIQSAFANFLFDPFKDGLKGMARSFLETIRRMAAEAAAASIMRGVLGENFEKGELGGWLGGIVGAVRGERPATPYPKGSVPDNQQVGPPAPATVGTAVGAAVAVDETTFEGVLGAFKTGFEQIFNGDFFKGLGSIFEQGFGGLVSMLGDLIGGLFGGGSGGSGGAGSMVAEGVGTAMSFIGSFFHTGGVVGTGDGTRRPVPAGVFAGARRYHAGGLAGGTAVPGLQPNEVPAVLMGGPKGQREEVLTADDPRHRDNLGSGGVPPPRAETARLLGATDARSWRSSLASLGSSLSQVINHSGQWSVASGQQKPSSLVTSHSSLATAPATDARRWRSSLASLGSSLSQVFNHGSGGVTPPRAETARLLGVATAMAPPAEASGGLRDPAALLEQGFPLAGLGFAPGSVGGPSATDARSWRSSLASLGSNLSQVINHSGQWSVASGQQKPSSLVTSHSSLATAPVTDARSWRTSLASLGSSLSQVINHSGQWSVASGQQRPSSLVTSHSSLATAPATDARRWRSSLASLGSSLSQVFNHGSGGVTPPRAETARLPRIALAEAPRYHSGGLVGLKSNEQPAILMGGPKGTREEVLTANDPRHRDNLGSGGVTPPRAGTAPLPSEQTVNVVNVLDPSLLGQFLSTRAGEKLVMNVMSRNSGALQRLVNRG